jgi:hypothetical protein
MELGRQRPTIQARAFCAPASHPRRGSELLSWLASMAGESVLCLSRVLSWASWWALSLFIRSVFRPLSVQCACETFVRALQKTTYLDQSKKTVCLLFFPSPPLSVCLLCALPFVCVCVYISLTQTCQKSLFCAIHSQFCYLQFYDRTTLPYFTKRSRIEIITFSKNKALLNKK